MTVLVIVIAYIIASVFAAYWYTHVQTYNQDGFVAGLIGSIWPIMLAGYPLVRSALWLVAEDTWARPRAWFARKRSWRDAQRAAKIGGLPKAKVRR